MEDIQTVSVITRLTYLLLLFLILGIFIERAVEIFMSALKYADLKLKRYKKWNNRATKFQERYEKLMQSQGSNTLDKKLLFKWILWRFVSEESYTGGKVIIAAKSIRTHYFRIYSRLFAFVLALVFSLIVYLGMDLDLVSLLENVGNVTLIKGDKELAGVKILLTAIILSAGSEPLHQVIKRAERIGKTRKSQAS